MRVLDVDYVEGAFLSERIRPGTPLTEWFDPSDPDGGRDLEATRVAAQLMLRLWRPAPPAQSSLNRRLCWGTGPLPPGMSPESYPGSLLGLYHAAAEMPCYPEIDNPVMHVFLHGNLHHGNILRDDSVPEGWRAVNPIGVTGHPATEAAVLLRGPANLLDHYNLKWLLRRRIAVLSEVLGIEREVLRIRGFIDALDSALSKVDEDSEGGGDAWQADAEIAELLRTA